MRAGFSRAAVAVVLLAAGYAKAPAQTEGISDGTVKIGVLTDMAGVFSDLAGAGAVMAAQMAIDDAVASYRALLAHGIPASSILVSGESAGGGLALALVLALRNAGDPLPAAIFAAAPFSDLTLSGPSVRTFNGDDPAANRDLLTFMGASYFQGHEPTDQLVSPLFGDLAGLPPLFVTASQGEVLLSDTTRLAERAEKAGVDVTLRVVEDSVHVYPIFPFLPETQATLDEVSAWARRNLRRNDTRTQAAE